MSAAPALAVQTEESDKDQLIQQLLKKIEQLEQRVDNLEKPGARASEPASSAGLETRLDEVIQQSSAEPVRSPFRLNVGAPLAEGLSFHGNFRWRGEGWNDLNSQYTGRKDDVVSFGQSIDLGFNFRVTERTEVLFELHDGRNWGDTVPGSNNTEQLFVSQAYLTTQNIYDSGFDLTLGRFEIEFGAERQLGDDDWRNIPVSFDGVHFWHDLGGGTDYSIVALRLYDGDQQFANEFSPGGIDTNPLNPGPDNTSNADFYGLYLNNESELGRLEGYFFYMDADSPSLITNNVGSFYLTDKTRLFTYGARWEADMGPLFWDVEAATQFGKVNGVRSKDYGFDAWAMYSRAGFKTEDIEFLESLYVGYDYATGDNGGNNENDAYVQLSPSLHSWFGIMDFASWQNIQHFVVGSAFELGPGTLDASWHWLRRDKEGQGNFGYNAMYGPGPGVGSDIGQEADLVYTFETSEDSALQYAADLGLGYFFAGEVATSPVTGSGNHADTLFGYMQFRVHF